MTHRLGLMLLGAALLFGCSHYAASTLRADRTSKFAVTQLVDKAEKRTASKFLFTIIVPIIASGYGEGAMPLSIGYAALGFRAQGDLLAKTPPAVMFNGLTAVLLADGPDMVGRRYRALTGNDVLRPGKDDEPIWADQPVRASSDLATIGGAVLLAMALDLIGGIVQKTTGFPAPVTMLFPAVALKPGRGVSPRLEYGAYHNYRQFATLVTCPLLFAIGVAKTPWEKLIGAFNAPMIATVFATVVTLMATGFVVGRLVGLYPIEAAIVNACHSGQGGTGYVAILSAANRTQLMPFAQVATRIGGAITVTLALAAYAHFGGG